MRTAFFAAVAAAAIALSSTEAVKLQYLEEMDYLYDDFELAEVEGNLSSSHLPRPPILNVAEGKPAEPKAGDQDDSDDDSSPAATPKSALKGGATSDVKPATTSPVKPTPQSPVMPTPTASKAKVLGTLEQKEQIAKERGELVKAAVLKKADQIAAAGTLNATDPAKKKVKDEIAVDSDESSEEADDDLSLQEPFELEGDQDSPPKVGPKNQEKIKKGWVPVSDKNGDVVDWLVPQPTEKEDSKPGKGDKTGKVPVATGEPKALIESQDAKNIATIKQLGKTARALSEAIEAGDAEQVQAIGEGAKAIAGLTCRAEQVISQEKPPKQVEVVKALTKSVPEVEDDHEVSMAVMPAQPAQPVEPAEPADPVEPAQPVKQIEQDEQVEPVIPMMKFKPAKKVKEVKSAKNGKEVKPDTQPIKKVKSTKPAKQTQSGQPGQ